MAAKHKLTYFYKHSIATNALSYATVLQVLDGFNPLDYIVIISLQTNSSPALLACFLQGLVGR